MDTSTGREGACFSRNLGTLTPAQQRKLDRSRIALFGLGGVGGICAELLVRAGVGHLMVVDSDRFERSNSNRQIHATRRTEARSKARVFAAHARDINPAVRIRAIERRLTEESLADFQSALGEFKPTLIIDAMDQAGSRVRLARLSRRLGIPYLYAAASGERGMVGVVGTRGPSLERMLRLPTSGRPETEIDAALVDYPQCRSAWGPATNLVGVLAANAALNRVLGKPYARAPRFWMVDAFREPIVRAERLEGDL